MKTLFSLLTSVLIGLGTVHAAPRVLAFGDSLTFGIGGSGSGYPELLSRFGGYEVINAGSPGDTAADGERRFAASLASAQPDLVLLCLGWNDLLRKVPRDISRARLERIVQQALQNNIPVRLLALPTPGLHNVDPLFDDWPNHAGLTIDSTTMPAVLGNPALMSDLVHPNAEGYRVIADRLIEEMQHSRRND